MATTHRLGPLIVLGASEGAEVNPIQGPSIFSQGVALLDPRNAPPFGGDLSISAYGWFGSDSLSVLYAAPSAIAAANIMALAVPVAGTPVTLVSSSGAGITVGVTVKNALTGANSTGNLAIDGAMGTTSYGAYAGIALYDPTKALARTIRITSAGNDSAATATIRGFDIYGFPLTETQTLTNASVTAGKKAFKYITSITPAGTLSGSNISVGTGDLFGLPIRSDNFGDVTIFWNSALITANTGYLAAITTDPSTATLGDTRGTYAVQSASDGTKRLEVIVRPSPNRLATTGLFGIQNV